MKVSGVRLMELYEKNNFSRVKFAGAVGVHEKTVRRWESGADVKEKYLKRICEVLGVVPADLKEDRVLVVGKGKREIPIIRLPGSLGEVIDYMVYDISNVSMIVIADSSMEPLIENGEHVFIEEATEPENGSVMLVEVEGQLHLRECRRVKDGYIRTQNENQPNFAPPLKDFRDGVLFPARICKVKPERSCGVFCPNQRKPPVSRGPKTI